MAELSFDNKGDTRHIHSFDVKPKGANNSGYNEMIVYKNTKGDVCVDMELCTSTENFLAKAAHSEEAFKALKSVRDFQDRLQKMYEEEGF